MDLCFHHGKLAAGLGLDLTISIFRFLNGGTGISFLYRYIVFFQQFLGLVFMEIHLVKICREDKEGALNAVGPGDFLQILYLTAMYRLLLFTLLLGSCGVAPRLRWPARQSDLGGSAFYRQAAALVVPVLSG